MYLMQQIIIGAVDMAVCVAIKFECRRQGFQNSNGSNNGISKQGIVFPIKGWRKVQV